MELWIWLFPAVYLIHHLEESFAGERFFNWTRHIVGRAIPLRPHLTQNGLFFGLMIVSVLILRAGRYPWLGIAAGAVQSGFVVGLAFATGRRPGA